MRRPVAVAMALACLAAFAVLIGLGTWQVQRLHWKEELLATIEARLHQPPMTIADLADRAATEGALEYTPVRASGRFAHDEEMFFFATHEGQSGWYVYTPLLLAPGETAPGDAILVNRGFVPYDMRDPATRPGSQPQGTVEVVGLARERIDGKPGFVVPDNQPGERTFFWKDWRTMVEVAGLDPATTVPFFIDAGPTARTELPRGGVTIVSLPNNHLQYAITWYGLAAALAGVVAVWSWRAWRRAAP